MVAFWAVDDQLVLVVMLEMILEIYRDSMLTGNYAELLRFVLGAQELKLRYEGRFGGAPSRTEVRRLF